MFVFDAYAVTPRDRTTYWVRQPIGSHYFLPLHAPNLSTSYLTLTIPSSCVVADLVLLREEPAHLYYFFGELTYSTLLLSFTLEGEDILIAKKAVQRIQRAKTKNGQRTLYRINMRS